MERRKYLATTGALLGSALAGCTSGDSSTDNPADSSDTEQPTDTQAQQGMLSTAVSDQPADIEDFETLEVTINEIWVYPQGAGSETDETDSGTDSPTDNHTTTDESTSTDSNSTAPTETETPDNDDESEDEEDNIIRIDAGGAVADLVQLQGDAQKVISSEFLPLGTYEQIKLFVSDDVNAVLNDGSQADVMTPGNAPLQFKQTFDVRENTRTTFTADFAPVKRGPNGYVLKPVATETKVAYSPIENSTPQPSDEATDTTTDASTDTAATEPPSGTESDTETAAE